LTDFKTFFNYQNQENTFNITITKDPTKPQVCSLWNVSVFKATFEKRRFL